MSVAIIVIGILAVVALVVLSFVFIKKRWLAFVVANLIIFVAGAVFTSLVFQDLNEMKEKFPVEKKLFVMMHKGDMIGAYVAGNENESDNIHDAAMLAKIRQSIATGQTDSLLKDYFKVIAVKSEAVEGVEMIDNGDIKMNEKEAFSVLDSSRPIDMFVNLELTRQFGNDYDQELANDTRQNLINEYGDDNGFKAEIFRIMFATMLQKKGTLFLIEQSKNNNVAFYPETITFSFMKIVPLPVFQYVKDKFFANDLPTETAG